VTLDRVEIGGIRVRDVEAFVLRDDALTTTLVGMSFLRKLASYSVADGSLSLKQ
jgi:aspartyl protease family protein